MATNRYLNEALFSEKSEKEATDTSNGVNSIVSRGLLSNTGLSCQIGIVSSKYWVGEEAAILNQPIAYTVTCKGVVSALRIKASDLHFFPPECLKVIAQRAKLKLQWVSKRFVGLSQVNANVLNDDMQNRIYQKSIVSIQKKYPQANSNALQNLRRLLLIKESKLTPSTIYRLSQYGTKANYLASRNEKKTEKAADLTGYELGVQGEREAPTIRETEGISPLKRLRGIHVVRRSSKLSQARTLRFHNKKELRPIAGAQNDSMANPYSILPEIPERLLFKHTTRKHERASSFMGGVSTPLH